VTEFTQGVWRDTLGTELQYAEVPHLSNLRYDFIGNLTLAQVQNFEHRNRAQTTSALSVQTTPSNTYLPQLPRPGQIGKAQSVRIANVQVQAAQLWHLGYVSKTIAIDASRGNPQNFSLVQTGEIPKSFVGDRAIVQSNTSQLTKRIHE